MAERVLQCKRKQRRKIEKLEMALQVLHFMHAPALLDLHPCLKLQITPTTSKGRELAAMAKQCTEGVVHRELLGCFSRASKKRADVAIESAGITLVKGNLDGIVRARKLARATMRNIRQNLFFALIYNASGVPVAAGVLYPFFGILIGPMFAAFAMSASSISVVLNSLRLRSAKL